MKLLLYVAAAALLLQGVACTGKPKPIPSEQPSQIDIELAKVRRDIDDFELNSAYLVGFEDAANYSICVQLGTKKCKPHAHHYEGKQLIEGLKDGKFK